MKILWVCNLILPEVAADMGLSTIPKEGWVKGLLDAVIALDNNQNDLVIAFPVLADTLRGEEAKKRGFLQGKCELENHKGRYVEYFGFYEDTVHEDVYDSALEKEFRGIIDLAQPDIVHCFGTEFPHTLAAARAWNRPERLLVGIQGPCTEYAKVYTAQLPEEVVKRYTFRDFIKRDSILRQQEKYVRRGINERAAVALAGHAAGRTAFDKKFVKDCKPDIIYHHAGENLRRNFYSGEWKREKAQKYRIFVSQADYPIKGFHYLLIALGKILKKAKEGEIGPLEGIEKLEVYVAGQSIVGYETVKQKLKISSYGKFLRQLLKKYGLQDKVHILGRLSADEMKEQYLLCDTFVCCSACENSPNSLGEAMILGVPIVTSEVGGITSVFNVGEDGFSYSLRAEDSLKKATGALEKALLERWNALPEEIDRRRENAQKHAQINHSTEKNAGDMLDIYASMI